MGRSVSTCAWMPAGEALEEHCVACVLSSPGSGDVRRGGDGYDGGDGGVGRWGGGGTGCSPAVPNEPSDEWRVPSLMLPRSCCLGNETKTKHFVQDAPPPHPS